MPAAAMAWSPKRAENVAIARPSSRTPALSTATSAVRSPSTARAGHHTTLSIAGTSATSRSDLRKVKYDSVP